LTLQRVFGRTVISVTEIDALEMPDGGGRWSKRAKKDAPA
jgi:hypothetical protein